MNESEKAPLERIEEAEKEIKCANYGRGKGHCVEISVQEEEIVRRVFPWVRTEGIAKMP